MFFSPPFFSGVGVFASFLPHSSVVPLSSSSLIQLTHPPILKPNARAYLHLPYPIKKTQLHGKKLRHPCVSKRSVAEHSFPQHNYLYSSFVLLLLHPLVPLATARHKTPPENSPLKPSLFSGSVSSACSRLHNLRCFLHYLRTVPTHHPINYRAVECLCVLVSKCRYVICPYCHYRRYSPNHHLPLQPLQSLQPLIFQPLQALLSLQPLIIRIFFPSIRNCRSTFLISCFPSINSVPIRY